MITIEQFHAIMLFYLLIDFALVIAQVTVGNRNLSTINTPFIWLICKNPVITNLTKDISKSTKECLGLFICGITYFTTFMISDDHLRQWFSVLIDLYQITFYIIIIHYLYNDLRKQFQK